MYSKGVVWSLAEKPCSKHQRYIVQHTYNTKHTLQLGYSPLPSNKSRNFTYVRSINDQRLIQELLFERQPEAGTKEVLKYVFEKQMEHIR